MRKHDGTKPCNKRQRVNQLRPRRVWVTAEWCLLCWGFMATINSIKAARSHSMPTK